MGIDIRKTDTALLKPCFLSQLFERRHDGLLVVKLQ
jgi:hypothetical protein